MLLMKKFTKVIALILSLTLLLCFPIGVSAAEPEDTGRRYRRQRLPDHLQGGSDQRREGRRMGTPATCLLESTTKT